MGSSNSVKLESESDRECYRCHLKGHIAKDCPVKREMVCYNFNESGHILSKCEKLRKSKNALVRYLKNNDQNSASKYYMHLIILQN